MSTFWGVWTTLVLLLLNYSRPFVVASQETPIFHDEKCFRPERTPLVNSSTLVLTVMVMSGVDFFDWRDVIRKTWAEKARGTKQRLFFNTIPTLRGDQIKIPLKKRDYKKKFGVVGDDRPVCIEVLFFIGIVAHGKSVDSNKLQEEIATFNDIVFIPMPEGMYS